MKTLPRNIIDSMTASSSKFSGLTDESESERNEQAIRHAVAQQALEGLKVSEETIADMRRAAVGEISDDEVIQNIFKRYSVCQSIRPATNKAIR